MAGALVISLDFELYWGVRDVRPLNSLERRRLLTARETVPALLRTFRQYDVHATWATVGLLFAHTREEAMEYRPAVMPRYTQVALDPYQERLGRDENDDPFHFAPSLIQKIAATPGQEIASHSFSHFYALEDGPLEDAFQDDAFSAQRIAQNRGYRLRSFVFPRNQVRTEYLPALQRAGFDCYRGARSASSFQAERQSWKRAMRLTDAYCNVFGMQTAAWPSRQEPANLSASRYLRPYSNRLRLLENARRRRIAAAMQSAAREDRIFHLWWHPEDFAGHPAANIEFLGSVLDVYAKCQRDHGMLSLTMAEAAERAA